MCVCVCMVPGFIGDGYCFVFGQFHYSSKASWSSSCIFSLMGKFGISTGDEIMQNL